MARLRLRLDPEFPAPRADHLRAAVASVKPELDLLHQHGSEGLIYRYPRVIYRVDRIGPAIVAVSEGVEALLGLTLVGQDLRLGSTVRRVTDASIQVAEDVLGATGTTRRYRLTSPWLALNQENHARFARLTPDEQGHFLDAQVANNCLSLAKSFGLRITSRLAGHARVRPLPVRMKDVEMTGFLGEIAVNFSIPEGLGLGKSVSKGFGAVRGLE